ncbi:hypothetical protein AB0F17_62080 [Nonomuraea sp. NPDC026600]|uniref:hypothetical protein n=1 Tax=Nonomuraea sp. NPDC026600 TaxID=3155363 RepID=UPI0033E153B4
MAITEIAARRAAPADLDAVAELIAATFPVPLASSLIPEAHRRKDILTSYVWQRLSRAAPHGHIHVLDTGPRITTVAVWLPRIDVSPPTDEGLLEPAGGPHYGTLFPTLERLLEARRPAQPHHYLVYLAVHPDREHFRRELTDVLLRHHHTYLDQLGMPAYLEANSRPARDLCRQHGYRRRPTAKLAGLSLRTSLPGVRFWPLWRPPHAGAEPAARTSRATSRPRNSLSLHNDPAPRKTHHR